MIDIITPEAQALIEKADGIVSQLSDFVISSQVDYDKAGEYLKQVKASQDILDKTRKSLTAPLDDSKARIMDLFRVPLEKLFGIAKTLSRARITYADAQEVKRRAEEARLAELQRKETDRLAKLAERAEGKGKTEKAEEWREKAQEAASIIPQVAPTLFKTEGVRTVIRWKAEVVDLMALVKAIAAGQASITFIEVNIPQINRQATATKDTLQIAGIRFFSEKSESR